MSLNRDENLKQNLNNLIEYLNLSDLKFTFNNQISNEQNSTDQKYTYIFDEAWANYSKLSQVYSFDNDQIHWIACSLYLAYEKIVYLIRKKLLIDKQNLGLITRKQSNVLEKQHQIQNEFNQIQFFSVIKMLRFVKLSLETFLKKIKKLNQMLNVPKELCTRLEKIESHFNVSSVLFKKYKLLFKNIFNCSQENFLSFISFELNPPATDNFDPFCEVKKIKRKKRDYSITYDLFKFGWLLFIFIKNQFPQINNDLVNSYHLLVCCINMIYQNLILLNDSNLNIILQEHLINDNSINRNHLFEYICKNYDGNLIEIKTINEHYFKPQLKNIFFDKNILHLNSNQDKINLINDLNEFYYLDRDELSRLKILNSNLKIAYENILLKNNDLNGFNLNSFINDFSFDIDERLYIDVNNYKNYNYDTFESDQEIDDTIETEDEIDSEFKMEIENKSNMIENKTIKKDFLLNLNIPNCLSSLLNKFNSTTSNCYLDSFLNNHILKPDFDSLNIDLNEHILNFVNSNCVYILKNCMMEQCIENISDMKIEHINDIKQNMIVLIDRFFEINFCFYLNSLETILCNEKKRLELQQISFKTYLKNIIKNESFQKSIYACCFDLMLNFSTISKTVNSSILSTDLNNNINSFLLNAIVDQSNSSYNNNDTNLSIKLVNILYAKSKSKFKFPFSIDSMNLKPFDFFRIIELFVKANSNTTTNSNTSTFNASTNNLNTNQTNRSNLKENEPYLDKEMIKYLSNLEERILESLAWNSDSSIWSHLSRLKLTNSNTISLSTESVQTQLNLPFPLYDEVGLNTGISNQSTNVNNFSSTGSLLGAAVLNNESCLTSPGRHPAITRVVCSTNSSTTTTLQNDNMILTSKTVPISSSNSSTKQIQVLTLTPTNSNSSKSINTANILMNNNNNTISKSQRLVNLNGFLTYFFRKFYNLVNIRIREFIDKLDLVNIINNLNKNNNLNFNTQISEINQTSQISNSNPSLTPITSASTPILTPVTSSNSSHQNNNLNIYQTNEHLQILLKKIWNIFEYSISVNGSSLIRDRHLDQLIICSIYITCKITNLPVQFNDILKVYKTFENANSSVYRQVLIEQSLPKEDLINFYNKIYVLNLKSYVLQLSSKITTQSQIINNSENKVFITPVNSLVSLSPVPKPASLNLNMSIQFSPRKLLCNQSVFITPSRTNFISGSVHLIQPSQNRNKISYTLNDLDSIKIIKSMNEIIKKNEVKIKTSNKRLFSEISSHNVIPTTSTQTNSIITTVVSNKLTNEDEPDGKIKLTKINSFGNNTNKQINTNTTNSNLTSGNTNFLSKIVNSSKLGSTSNSNLITMVIGSTVTNSSNSTNILPISSSFAKRLHNIQTERANVK